MHCVRAASSREKAQQCHPARCALARLPVAARARRAPLSLIFRSARIAIGGRMPHPRRIEPVQPGLRHDHWPVRMAAAHLAQRTQHDILNRIRYLHRDQQQVRLLFAPSHVISRIVVGLTKTARIEKAKNRRLWRHVIDYRRSRAGFEALPNLSALVAGERGDDRCLSGTGLAKQPHDRRIHLGTSTDSLQAGGTAVPVCLNRASLTAFHSRSRSPTIFLASPVLLKRDWRESAWSAASSAWIRNATPAPGRTSRSR